MVFTREYLMRDLVDFQPSRKNVDRKWEKMECTGTHLQVRCVYPFWDNAPTPLTYTRINAGVLTKETDHLKIPVSWFFFEKGVTVLIVVYLCSVFLSGIWCTHQQCPIFKMDYFWCDIFSLFSSPIFHISGAIFHQFLFKRKLCLLKLNYFKKQSSLSSFYFT